ncbi:hypothetical protein [Schlesneria sp. DSM 10557]|uniref:hypothetical protein n=1 Tax=Schlesneria sp. DSM 10557 TaxID=3044399 RepID=UPI0035A0A08E
MSSLSTYMHQVLARSPSKRVDKRVDKYVHDRKAMIAGRKADEKRKLRKAALLAENPTCAHCGRTLTAVAGKEDSAHLLIDRLSCFEHTRLVKAYALFDSQTSRVSYSPPLPGHESDRPRPPSRDVQKKELLKANPYCLVCRTRLGYGETFLAAPHLCKGELYCPDCVNIVRQGRDRREPEKVLKEIEEIRLSLTVQGRLYLNEIAARNASDVPNKPR